MAWKLRKDKLQAETPKEETEAKDTAAAAAAPPGAVPAESIAPPSFENEAAQGHSFALPEVEPHGGEIEEPQFAPLDFDAAAFHAGRDPAAEAHDQAEEEPLFQPMSESGGHAFDLLGAAETPTHGAGAVQEPQFHSEEPVFAPPPAFESESVPPDTDRRQGVAPGLLMPETESSIPRVAPFIVDVPPVEETSATSGTLVLRIGKLSATFPISKDVTVIGRPDTATQSYPDVEIELDDAVSRRHAEIRRHDGGYYLVDTMSTNGTRLNGERVEAYQEYRLDHGDRINLGDLTEIVFE